LANQRHLSNFYAVVDRRQHDGALAEGALVQPFHPVGGKRYFTRTEGFGREPRRDLVVDGFLFRNRYHHPTSGQRDAGGTGARSLPRLCRLSTPLTGAAMTSKNAVIKNT